MAYVEKLKDGTNHLVKEPSDKAKSPAVTTVGGNNDAFKNAWWNTMTADQKIAQVGKSMPCMNGNVCQ